MNNQEKRFGTFGPKFVTSGISKDSREMSDWVTRLSWRDKFKVGFLFLMAYPREVIPVILLHDTLNDEKKNQFW